MFFFLDGHLIAPSRLGIEPQDSQIKELTFSHVSNNQNGSFSFHFFFLFNKEKVAKEFFEKMLKKMREYFELNIEMKEH